MFLIKKFVLLILVFMLILTGCSVSGDLLDSEKNLDVKTQVIESYNIIENKETKNHLYTSAVEFQQNILNLGDAPLNIYLSNCNEHFFEKNNIFMSSKTDATGMNYKIEKVTLKEENNKNILCIYINYNESSQDAIANYHFLIQFDKNNTPQIDDVNFVYNKPSQELIPMIPQT